MSVATDIATDEPAIDGRPDGAREGLTCLALAAGVLVPSLLLILMGERAPLFTLDFADIYLDKFEQCARFLTNPGDNAWSGESLRGWPALYGSVTPHHIGCALRSVTSLPATALGFIAAVEITATIGAYVFARRIFGLRQNWSVVCALLFYAHEAYYIENIYVTQITLLPAVTVVALAPARGRRLILVGLAHLWLYLFFFPPYTLPLMPLYQLALLLGLRSRLSLPGGTVLARFALFWGAYCALLWPSLLGIASDWNSSNRAIWRSAAPTGTFSSYLRDFGTNVEHFARHRGTIAPTFGLVALLLFRNWQRRAQSRRAIVALPVSLILLVLITAFVQSQGFLSITSSVPAVQAASFLYARIFFVVPLLVLLVVASSIAARPTQSLAMRPVLVATTLVGLLGGLGLARYRSLVIVAGYFALTVFFGLLAVLASRVRPHRLVVVALLAVVTAVPFKAFQQFASTYGGVQAPFGLALADNFRYPPDRQPSRVLTVAASCFSGRLFPAQVALRGLHTMDGASVFYSALIADEWRRVAKSDPTNPCSVNYNSWNNRLDLTVSEWERNEHLLLPWIMLNNVRYIRTEARLTSTRLREIGTGTITDTRFGDRLLRLIGSRRPGPSWTNFYVYQVAGALPRVFALSGTAATALERGTLEPALDEATPVSLSAYAPARLRFAHRGGVDDVLLASENYHPGWRLRVDGRPAPDRIGRGPLGILAVRARPGRHVYELRFGESAALKFWSGYVLMALALGLGLRQIGRKANSHR